MTCSLEAESDASRAAGRATALRPVCGADPGQSAGFSLLFG
jgi:hypothetical protein